MKKWIFILFAVVLLSSLSGVTLAATIDRCLPGSAGASCDSEAAVQVVAENLQISEIEYKEWPFDISYPRLSGMSDKAAEGKINAVLQKRVDAFVAEMKEDSEEGKDLPLYKYFAAKINFEVHLKDTGFVSLTLQTYRFTGGAHGSSSLEGYPFNLKTGQLLKYGDMFNFDAVTRQTLNNEIARQIRERKIPIFEPYKGLSDIPGFYLKSNKTVVFVFQQYEIAPYSSGILEFEIPY